ncbi:MAG TPA: gamma-glutamyl-gamma-aminobutyrate hydrolase family protein [Spongiibacteraceae bacterium]|nr:gamma-glutamyl-gamma-aminobutyrate hydrolase family protein [Spongiibacteraceae bacterium]
MKPLIGVTSERVSAEGYYWHRVEEHYPMAIIEAAGGIPVMIPSLAKQLDLRGLLQRLDGLLLTGGASNIEPEFYGHASEQPNSPRDRLRDETVLALIPEAIALGVPVLGICRGLQEMNVALGGTLHQRVHRVEGKQDHREDRDAPVADQYKLVHRVHLQPNGLLAALSNDSEIEVNSVHGQGIDVLAPGLRVEALAPDGLIEAVSLPSAKVFTCAVQWHPEWFVQTTPFCRALLAKFGEECRTYRLDK